MTDERILFMKKSTITIIIICVLLICGGFYVFTQNDTQKETELTEVQKIITKDLENDYPKTPREVIKWYNRIVECYYDDDKENEGLEELSLQMQKLLDEELLLVNGGEDYYNSLLTEVAYYESNEMYIVETDVCPTNQVKLITDKEKGDNLAYVTASYFLKIGNNDFSKTYQEFILREDEEGKWKILYMKKGEAWDE